MCTMSLDACIYVCTYIHMHVFTNNQLLKFAGFVNENETLFTYNQQIDQSWASFYDPGFQPIFTVTVNENLRSVCGNNTFCLYDIAATGSMEIGLSTLDGSNQYDEIVQLSYPGKSVW